MQRWGFFWGINCHHNSQSRWFILNHGRHSSLSPRTNLLLYGKGPNWSNSCFVRWLRRCLVQNPGYRSHFRLIWKFSLVSPPYVSPPLLSTPRSQRLTQSSETYTSKIPASLPSGDYLLRTQQLAIHNPYPAGIPQFYISCAQVTVTNGGAGKPAPLVSIPGFITGTEPGYTVNIYNNFKNYTVPGPAVVSWNQTVYFWKAD